MFRGFFEGIGSIDERGVLRVTGDLNCFLKQHTDKRVIVKLAVYDKRNTSAVMAYYLKVIVPAFVKALYETGDRCTFKTAEERLRSMSVVCTDTVINYETGEISESTKELRDLTAAEWVDFISELKQILAESPLCIYVEDGRIL